jgi:hypothetical protein
MVIKYILFNSFFPDHAWNPSEQLLDILADTTDEDEAN